MQTLEKICNTYFGVNRMFLKEAFCVFEGAYRREPPPNQLVNASPATFIFFSDHWIFLNVLVLPLTVNDTTPSAFPGELHVASNDTEFHCPFLNASPLPLQRSMPAPLV